MQLSYLGLEFLFRRQPIVCDDERDSSAAAKFIVGLFTVGWARTPKRKTAILNMCVQFRIRATVELRLRRLGSVKWFIIIRPITSLRAPAEISQVLSPKC